MPCQQPGMRDRRLSCRTSRAQLAPFAFPIFVGKFWTQTPAFMVTRFLRPRDFYASRSVCLFRTNHSDWIPALWDSAVKGGYCHIHEFWPSFTPYFLRLIRLHPTVPPIISYTLKHHLLISLSISNSQPTSLSQHSRFHSSTWLSFTAFLIEIL